MRRALICLCFVLVPCAAQAADGWAAAMQDDEGGQALVASVTGDPDGDVMPTLSIQCGGSQGVMLRYLLSADAGSTGGEADFLFENGGQQARLHMIYEDMDGAFAAYFPKTDPMIALLETGDDVYISEASGNYAAQSFSLKGSTKAISKALKGC